MGDVISYGKVGRSKPTTPALVKKAGGIFKGLWVTEDAMLVMFEDAEQAPPRTSLTVRYTDMHESGDPVGFIRKHIEESRIKFREAEDGKSS